jgi:hypothetical protein
VYVPIRYQFSDQGKHVGDCPPAWCRIHVLQRDKARKREYKKPYHSTNDPQPLKEIEFHFSKRMTFLNLHKKRITIQMLLSTFSNWVIRLNPVELLSAASLTTILE